MTLTYIYLCKHAYKTVFIYAFILWPQFSFSFTFSFQSLSESMCKCVISHSIVCVKNVDLHLTPLHSMAINNLVIKPRKHRCFNVLTYKKKQASMLCNSFALLSICYLNAKQKSYSCQYVNN